MDPKKKMALPSSESESPFQRIYIFSGDSVTVSFGAVNAGFLGMELDGICMNLFKGNPDG